MFVVVRVECRFWLVVSLYHLFFLCRIISSGFGWIVALAVKRSLSGAFSALQPKADRTLTPSFLHSSPEAPRTTQALETSASEGRNYYQGI